MVAVDHTIRVLMLSLALLVSTSSSYPTESHNVNPANQLMNTVLAHGLGAAAPPIAPELIPTFTTRLSKTSSVVSTNKKNSDETITPVVLLSKSVDPANAPTITQHRVVTLSDGQTSGSNVLSTKNVEKNTNTHSQDNVLASRIAFSSVKPPSPVYVPSSGITSSSGVVPSPISTPYSVKTLSSGKTISSVNAPPSRHAPSISEALPSVNAPSYRQVPPLIKTISSGKGPSYPFKAISSNKAMSSTNAVSPIKSPSPLYTLSTRIAPPLVKVVPSVNVPSPVNTVSLRHAPSPSNTLLPGAALSPPNALSPRNALPPSTVLSHAPSVPNADDALAPVSGGSLPTSVNNKRAIDDTTNVRSSTFGKQHSPAPAVVAAPVPVSDGRCRAGFSVRKGLFGANQKTPSARVYFQDVLTNAGGWATTRQQFEAPCTGLYYFSFHAVSLEDQDFTIALMKEGEYQVTAYGSKGGYQWGSNSALLFLNPGDRVYLELQQGEIYEHPFNEAYTTFTGFLVNEI